MENTMHAFKPAEDSKGVFVSEEARQDKRRKKALGWVLLVNSLVALGFTFINFKFGTADDLVKANIVPAVIDILIAVALFKSKPGTKDSILLWVFARATIGFLLWGGMFISKGDWVSFAMELPYTVYLIYHSRAKATAGSYRLAMKILTVAVVAFVVGVAYTYTHAKQSGISYDAKIKVLTQKINDSYSRQRTLVSYPPINDEDKEEAVKNREEVLKVSRLQKTQIEEIMPILDQGLKDFKDPASQNNITNLKTLYQLEMQVNEKVIDFYEYVGTLDPGNLTQPQVDTYKQKEKAVNDAYEAARQQGLKMQQK